MVAFCTCRVHGQEVVTWADHIGCLIYSHCSPCHNSEGIAPFALQSYEDVKDRRFLLEPIISSRTMPPWPPGKNYGHIAGERSLTDEEIELFRTWVETGAAAGNMEAAPMPPVYETNLEIADPDFELRLPTYEVPPSDELDLYRCFVVPTDEPEDRFITAIEIIPGNRSIVHHVILFQDTTDEAFVLDEEEPGLGYTCFGGTGTSTISMISGWVPGSSAVYAPEGMGIHLPKGATLIAQLHYPEGSEGQKDSTLIRLKFSEHEDLRRIENLPVLNHSFGMDRPLFIPANTRQTFHQKFFPVPFKVIVTGIAPHAHLICESMKAFATTPGGDTIPLIEIPHWDFEWQGFYQFQKPVVIPAFSTLHGTATYNNTTTNHHLPTDMPVDVSVGEATTDEMMIFFLSLSRYHDGDEDMIIDTTSHKPHYNDCVIGNFITTTSEPSFVDFQVYPNPASHSLVVDVQDPGSADLDFVIADLFGRVVSRYKILRHKNVLELPPQIKTGIYFYRIYSRDHKQYRWNKILITK